MELNAADIKTLLLALNDREGVLSADWEAATKANSTALTISLCAELRDVRRLATVLTEQQTEDLLDDFNYVGSRHHY